MVFEASQLDPIVAFQPLTKSKELRQQSICLVFACLTFDKFLPRNPIEPQTFEGLASNLVTPTVIIFSENPLRSVIRRFWVRKKTYDLRLFNSINHLVMISDVQLHSFLKLMLQLARAPSSRSTQTTSSP